MSEPDGNAEQVRRWWAQFNETGVVPTDIFDEAVEMSNPSAFPVTAPYVGHEGIRTWATETWDMFEELHHDVSVVAASGGDTVVSVHHLRGTLRHSQIAWQTEWAAVWSFRDGLAYKVQGYLSREQALAAAGIEGG